MKKILIILLVSFFGWNCNEHKNNQENKVTTPVDNSHHDHENGGLTLSNGVKWKADSITRSGAKKETIENYIQTATQIQDGLNKMISECKMNGPDHDALHLWLEPLLEATNDMKNSTTIEMAGEKIKKIEERIHLFTQYFE